MRATWMFLTALACISLSACRANTAANAVATVATVPLSITTSKKVHHFNIEVARTPAEQERGLMFRTSIAPDGGMIFPMDPPRVASFWMKNCPIPQDWMFIRADGTIARIAENTIPYSLEPISSGEPVAAVLEIAGGRISELGISEGDRVSWPR